MKNLLLTLFIFLTTLSAFSQKKASAKAKIIDLYLEYKFEYPKLKFRKFIYINIEEQKLYYTVRNKIKKSYSISSATLGTGSESGSNKTPLGLHKVDQKFGENTPQGGILKDRMFTKQIATITTDTTDSDNDHVTSRILWLRGLELGKNSGTGVDSYLRYIYIHGTAEEGLIGAPASHGCIRMLNADVIELYNLVKVGIAVIISAN